MPGYDTAVSSVRPSERNFCAAQFVYEAVSISAICDGSTFATTHPYICQEAPSAPPQLDAHFLEYRPAGGPQNSSPRNAGKIAKWGRNPRVSKRGQHTSEVTRSGHEKARRSLTPDSVIDHRARQHRAAPSAIDIRAARPLSADPTTPTSVRRARRMLRS